MMTFSHGHTTELALTGLERMYDHSHRLFARTLEYRSGQIILQGTSIRYTAISLLGLIKASQVGWRGSFDVHDVLTGLMDRIDECRNVGDLGLILWNYALIPEEYPAFLWRLIRHHYALLKTGESLIRAMELEWLLTGLSYAYQTWHHSSIEEMAHQVYQSLLGYYFHPMTGLFSCASGEGGARVKSLSRQRLGFLAEQAYGIYAFSVYAQNFNDPLAAEYALSSGRRLCALQGNEGEWWWRYNVQTGRVANRYPLFPVHQDAVVPMALTKLEQVSGESFQESIEQGHSWLRRYAMSSAIDWRNQIIYHHMRPRLPWNLIYYVNSILSMLNRSCFRTPSRCVPGLEIKSQDLGWILYAHAQVKQP